MKKRRIVSFFTSAVAIMFFYCITAFANGGSSAVVVNKSIQNSVCNNDCNISSKVSNNGKMLRVVMQKGSLKGNIQKIANRYGWKNVVWKSSEDYYWRGITTVTGADITEVMQKILDGYPLQAIFYSGNHVLVILPRTLK